MADNSDSLAAANLALGEQADAVPWLLTLALIAPCCAVDPVDPRLIHAATMEGIIAVMNDKPLVAPCGAGGLLVPYSNRRVLSWPPRVAGLAPYERCHPCWVATGKPRPKVARRDPPG